MSKLLLILMLLLITLATHADEPQYDLAREICIRIFTTIEYVASPKIIKTPADTWLDGTGDCADMSALMIHMMTSRGADAKFVVLALSNGRRHVVVLYEGYYYDPTVGLVYSPRKYPIAFQVIEWRTADRLLSDWED